MNVTIDDSYGYKLINQTKAETIIKDVANRLTQSKVIGSGWEYTKQMKKPIFVAVKSGIYVSDQAYKK